MPKRRRKQFPKELVPACPRPEQDGGKVTHWGTYGVRRRPRFRCKPTVPTPSNPSMKPHTFGAAPMARPMPHPLVGSCAHCSRDYFLYDSPMGPWRHGYALPEIAEALVRLARGTSYTRVSLDMHLETKALRRKPKSTILTEQRDPQWGLTGDWTEVYAPALHSELQEHWDIGGGTVVIDVQPFMFRFRSPKRHASGKMGRFLAFNVFVIGAYLRNDPTELRIVAMGALPPKQSPLGLLSKLKGVPNRTLADDGSNVQWALKKAWPSAQHDYCLWHLRTNAEKILAKHGHKQHVAYNLLHFAFADETTWDKWLSFGRNIHPELDTWIKKVDKRVRRQLRLGLKPRSTGELEQAVMYVRRHIGYRRTGFRNQQRTDRLLQLMALHLNKLDDPLLFTHVLHMWIERQPHPGQPGPRHVVMKGPRLN